MRKKKNTKKQTGKIILLVVLSLLLAAELCIFVIPQALYGQSGDYVVFDEEDRREPTDAQNQQEALTQIAEETEIPAATETAPAPVEGLEFPQTVDEGKLKIDMLFQFDGINPDCGNEESEEIAATVVTNLSDSFLSEATIDMELSDGTRVTFILTDLPAGKSAMVFSTENLATQEDDVCIDLNCKTDWSEETTAIPETVTAEVDGMSVSLTNNTEKDLTNVVVYCKALLGEEYFGGITYAYTVDTIPAGETVIVDAIDCITGMAEVVRIVLK